MARPPGRPRATYGPLARAILAAAKQQPGTVRDLAARAQVGFGLAKKTANRLLAYGELMQAEPCRRPMVLTVASKEVAAGTELGDVLRAWCR